MIWLTWRQMRQSTLMVAVGLALLAVLLLANRQAMEDAYGDSLGACGPADPRCAAQAFNDYQTPFLLLTLLVLVVPALVGLFWGAPLVAREIEAGTHRLVWSQSVTRTRWLAVKLALTGLVSAAAAGLISLLVGWWAGPLDEGANGHFPRMAPLLFAGRGITPVAYAAFAFVLGVTVGMLVRRALPAMGLTLLVFVAVQVVVPNLIRPHLLSPVTVALQVDAADTGLGWSPDGDIRLDIGPETLGDPGAWVLSSHVVDADGNQLDGIPQTGLTSCGAPGPPDPQVGDGRVRAPGDIPTCLEEIASLGYGEEITYFPSSRFWTLQSIESALYLAFSALLAAGSFWILRRRIN
jgi:hypothetical protein